MFSKTKYIKFSSFFYPSNLRRILYHIPWNEQPVRNHTFKRYMRWNDGDGNKNYHQIYHVRFYHERCAGLGIYQRYQFIYENGETEYKMGFFGHHKKTSFRYGIVGHKTNKCIFLIARRPVVITTTTTTTTIPKTTIENFYSESGKKTFDQKRDQKL